jgi:hypothetical protein
MDGGKGVGVAVAVGMLWVGTTCVPVALGTIVSGCALQPMKKRLQLTRRIIFSSLMFVRNLFLHAFNNDGSYFTIQ